MSGRRLVVPRSARSEVWNYFGFEADQVESPSKGDKRYVFCRMCDTKLLFSGNTTNLSSHIGRCPKRMLIDHYYYQGTTQVSTATPTDVFDDLQGNSTDSSDEFTPMNNENTSSQQVCPPVASDENITVLDSLEGKQEYCLKWKYHQANQQGMFFQLLETERFCDVSIVCEEKFLKAHKLVLSACSSYFENILVQLEDRNPVIILRGVKHSDMSALIQFMYKGEINIEQDQLASLLETADFLKVKGLSDKSTEGQKFSTVQDASAHCETSVQEDSEPSPSGQQNKRTISNMEVHKPVKMQRSDLEPGPNLERERHCIKGIVQMNKYLEEKGKFEQFWREPWVAQAMREISRRHMTIKDCSDLLGVPYRIMYTHYRQVRDNEHQVYREHPTTVSQEGGRITLKCNEIAAVPADKKNKADQETDSSLGKNRVDQEIDPNIIVKVECMDSQSQ